MDKEDDYDDYHGDHDGLDNAVVGGRPTKPDCLHMTAEEANQAMKDYQKERKAYTDRVRCQRHKQSEDYYDHSITYSGCVSDKLQLMTDLRR